MKTILRYLFTIIPYVNLRSNRINIIKTLLINFFYLPFNIGKFFPILIYGKCTIKLNPSGKIKFLGEIKRGILKIGLSDPVRSYYGHSFLDIRGTLIIEGNVIIRRGINIELKENAEVVLGRNVFISDNCTFISEQSIIIKSNTVIGNNCNILDTDLHYILSIKNKSISRCQRNVIIGENNWITGYCFVKKGTITPYGTIVAGPYSIIDKDYTKFLPKCTIISEF